MKNLKTIIAILTGIALLSSCVKEDLNDCPRENLTLNLSYLGDTNNPLMFDHMIDRVMVFVFNESGQQVLKQTFEKADIRDMKVELELPTGQTYHIVCWGNAFDGTQITEGALRNDFRVNPTNYGKEGAAITSGDHLYLSKDCTVTIPSGENASGDVVFKGAHNNLEVYISSFGEKDKPETYPIVEVSNLMPQCDFNMNPTQPATTTYYPVTEFDESHGMMSVKLATMQFDNDNPIIITVKDPVTKEVRYSFNLKDYIKRSQINVNNKEERTVVVQVCFTDLGVSIKIPEWLITDMNPA